MNNFNLVLFYKSFSFLYHHLLCFFACKFQYNRYNHVIAQFYDKITTNLLTNSGHCLLLLTSTVGACEHGGGREEGLSFRQLFSCSPLPGLFSFSSWFMTSMTQKISFHFITLTNEIRPRFYSTSPHQQSTVSLAVNDSSSKITPHQHLNSLIVLEEWEPRAWHKRKRSIASKSSQFIRPFITSGPPWSLNNYVHFFDFIFFHQGIHRQ